MPVELALQRLRQQRLAQPEFERPAEVAAWLGAVQAQDYNGALWAVGLRMRSAMEACVEEALASKSIVRIWFMRGTLHMVAAADLRWMLGLVGPRMRILADNMARYQQLGIDAATLDRSFAVLARSLEGGRQLTRGEIAAELERAGVATAGLRFTHIVQRAQADGLLCHGVRRGKQFTFALLDEWVPGAPVMDRAAALGELARRYFTSHGPATLQDFVWWTGLTTADARAGVEMARAHLAEAVIAGQTYWLAPGASGARDRGPRVYLLPPYDEYLVAYRDRSAAEDPQRPGSSLRVMPFDKWTIVIKGRVAGTWRRALRKSAVSITTAPFDALSAADARGLAAAARRYGDFLGVPVVVA